MIHQDLTHLIIQSYYNVYHKLGYGFLEKVYENAMIIELSKHKLFCEQQKRINVYYDDAIVGIYFADISVENKVIIEIKAAEMLKKPNEYQLLNYLKATDVEVGLLLNFGTRPQFTRKIFSNAPKEEIKESGK